MSKATKRTWSDIKDYCQQRLAEIRRINEQFSCPSGFVCIAAFMGYLSRLAYGTNEKSDHSDGKWFKQFVDYFMPSKYRGHGDLMYNTFRCGILHSMSFDDEISDARMNYLKQIGGATTGYPDLAISHDAGKYCVFCQGAQLQTLPGTQTYVLVASVLCDDIDRAIETMFSDSSVRLNMEAFVACQRSIGEIELPPTSISGKPMIKDTALSA